MRRLLTLAMLSLFAPAFAAEEPAGAAKPYTLKNCIVSGEELGGMGKPVSKVYEGQEVKFCCKSCIKKFEKDQAAFLKKIADKSEADKAAK
jgi:YHS domain-containing protein